jgi:hypothetical protein
MARPPSYPKDSPVDPPSPAASAKESKGAESSRTKHLVTGAAIGIGSAAIVAALLWHNRSKKDDEGPR